MTVVIFIAAILWGMFSAQCLVQVVTSAMISLIYLTALPFSHVPKTNNLIACVVSLLPAVVFAVLFFVGNYISADYIDYDTWNADTIASTVSFVGTLFYCGAQVPGRLLIARMSAWHYAFFEALNVHKPADRLAVAREMKAALKRPGGETPAA